MSAPERAGVLSVIDRASGALFVLGSPYSEPLMQAGTAIAELIEAAKKVDATKGSTSDERIRLRLALARCQPDQESKP